MTVFYHPYPSPTVAKVCCLCVTGMLFMCHTYVVYVSPFYQLSFALTHASHTHTHTSCLMVFTLMLIVLIYCGHWPWASQLYNLVLLSHNPLTDFNFCDLGCGKPLQAWSCTTLVAFYCVSPSCHTTYIHNRWKWEDSLWIDGGIHTTSLGDLVGIHTSIFAVSILNLHYVFVPSWAKAIKQDRTQPFCFCSELVERSETVTNESQLRFWYIAIYI